MNVVMFRVYSARVYGQGWQFNTFLLRRDAVAKYLEFKKAGVPAMMTETYELVLESHGLNRDEQAAMDAPDPSA